MTTLISEPSTPPQPATAGFVHLHTHSEYSPLDGLATMSDLVTAAAADANPALAITDHGTLGGIWKLGKYAKKAGIKAIPGLEAYLAIGDRLADPPEFIRVPADADTGDADDLEKDVKGATGETKMKRRFYEHVTILATSPTGWRNLVLMHNASQDSAYGKYPRIDHKLLAQHAEGLIVLTGCIGGPVAGPLARGDVELARTGLRHLITSVGKDNVYVEVMDHGIPDQAAAVPGLLALAREFDLPLVATNDSHFTHAEDDDAHAAWLALSSGKKLDDPSRFQFHGHGHHLRTETEMRALFDGADWWQTACDNTVAIAERVSDQVLPTPKMRLPKFPVPEGFASSDAYLRQLVRDGAFARHGEHPTKPGRLPDDVNERLKYEFEVITAQGFSDYFLIVWDLIEWARSDRGLPSEQHPRGRAGAKMPIRVGPGRGSAAGSEVSYDLKIVGVPPIKNGLLFERFLDPQRAGMPDIDVDFEKARRAEVLAYLVRKYGWDRIAQIGTFGLALSKAAIKDAGRVLGLTHIADKLSPLVPADPKPLPFAALDNVANPATLPFRQAVAKEGEAAQQILELARTFEGVIKVPGIHACGVLLADESMLDLVPLRKNRSKDAPAGAPMITEWDGKDVEEYGLLKLDVLGLRTLDVISAAARYVTEGTGEVIDTDELDADDHSERSDRTWALLRAGKTAGVFQMESAGMTKLAEDAGPDSLDDLSAIVALYRPGPMAENMHTRWAARKRGTEQVDYSIFTTNPAEQAVIATVLDESKGIITFQEQAMRLGDVLAGFGPVERNRLRKAISKKVQAEIDELGILWMVGAAREDRDDSGAVTKIAFAESTAVKVWDAIKGAAAYAFNKSHSTAYGQLAYVTAHMKANFPVAFGAAILATTKDDDKRLGAMLALAGDGIEVLAPDVNASGIDTAPDGPAVRLGLREVKGVGSNAAHIVAAREQGGPFTSMSDLLQRVKVQEKDALKNIPITAVEALIEAGAFDSMGPRLGQMMIARAARTHPDTTVPDAEWGLLERSARQRTRLGVITGEHPLRSFGPALSAWRTPDRFENPGKPVHTVHDAPAKARVTLLGVLSAWTEKPYSKGRFAAITLEGTRGSIEGVMWDDDRVRLGFVPTVGSLVALRADVRLRTVDVEDEEGNVTSVERRELNIRDLWTVEVTDPARLVVPALEQPLQIPVRVVSHPLLLFIRGQADQSLVDLCAMSSDEIVDPVRSALRLGRPAMGLDACTASLWLVARDGHVERAITFGEVSQRAEQAAADLASSDDQFATWTCLDPQTGAPLLDQPVGAEVA